MYLDVLHKVGCNSLEIHIGAGAVMNGCMALERGKSCYFKFPKEVVYGILPLSQCSLRKQDALLGIYMVILWI